MASHQALRETTSTGEIEPHREESHWPIEICLLGFFQLRTNGRPVATRGHGKAEMLLTALALRRGYVAPREFLLDAVWGDAAFGLAGQSLSTLLYALHKQLGDAIGGEAPVLHVDGCYRLNVEAGVRVDTGLFDQCIATGEQASADGDAAAAAVSFERAIRMYRGDLSAGTDAQAVIQRERLRAAHLRVLARLADFHYQRRNYGACLDHALALLQQDPCREDAHRFAMRCYVHGGERAQALRQYRLCESILRAEFDTEPEAATKLLFEQVRLKPECL